MRVKCDICGQDTGLSMESENEHQTATQVGRYRTEESCTEEAFRNIHKIIDRILGTMEKLTGAVAELREERHLGGVAVYQVQTWPEDGLPTHPIPIIAVSCEHAAQIYKRITNAALKPGDRVVVHTGTERTFIVT